MTEQTPAPATTIAEYSPTAEALAGLRQKYSGIVFDVSTKGGMVEARAAAGELRTLRVALEAKRKEIKEPALTRCREIDTEAKRITAELAKLEDPIVATIQAEVERKEREKAAAEQADRERIAEVNRRFEEVKTLVLVANGKTVDQISELLAKAEAFDVESFAADTQPAARFERQLAINGLKALRDARAAQDQKDAETAERLKRLDELEAAERQRQADAQAEADRKAAEEAEAARQREVQAAQERAQVEAARQEELRQREAEIAERDRVAAAERAEADRVAREERERLQMLASEIEGIRQQGLIAVGGRLGVRKGGTLECARETLAETEAWPVTAEHFGPLFATAEAVKADAIATIKRTITGLEEAARIAAEQQAEAERQAAERQRLADEAVRLAAEKEQREIANASLIEAATEALPLLKEGYPRHKATKKLAAALAREQREAA